MFGHSTRLGFLDGLRGISILLVLFGHSLPKNQKISPYLEPFFDGALGVRIFFVISGFIITWLLLQEKQLKGKISWGDFLLKRLTKLVPSMALYIFVLWVVSHFESINCSSSAYFISLFFLTEIFGRECWHLGHTWSLSVEEIFYLLWLPMIQMFDKDKIRNVLIVAICLGPLVRVYNYLVNAKPYLFPFEGIVIPFISHADVIGFGALAAWVCFFRKTKWFGFYPKIPILSFWLLSLFFLSALPFYALKKGDILKYVALPFASTVQGFVISILIVALFSGVDEGFSKLLNMKVLGFLGRVSYSLYLWQQPFLNPYQADWSSMEGVANTILRFGTALTSGIVFFFVVEQPMMRWLRKRLRVSSSDFLRPSPRIVEGSVT